MSKHSKSIRHLAYEHIKRYDDVTYGDVFITVSKEIVKIRNKYEVVNYLNSVPYGDKYIDMLFTLRREL